MPLYELALGFDQEIRQFTFSLEAMGKSGWCWLKLIAMQSLKHGTYICLEHTEVDPADDFYHMFSHPWRGRKMSNGEVYIFKIYDNRHGQLLDEVDEITILPEDLQTDTI